MRKYEGNPHTKYYAPIKIFQCSLYDLNLIGWNKSHILDITIYFVGRLSFVFIIMKSHDPQTKKNKTKILFDLYYFN